MADLERLFAFLSDDLETAKASATAIRTAVDLLQHHPLIGRMAGELRELIISFGRTGYVALYEYVPGTDVVYVLGIRHQRELDYAP